MATNEGKDIGILIGPRVLKYLLCTDILLKSERINNKNVKYVISKVSSSCTSVYVDGSETRGALNAEVKVKYGTFSGHGFFTVWMAEIPLELEIPDTKLSQIKSWKVPASVEK